MKDGAERLDERNPAPVESEEVLVAVWWQGARVPEKGRQDIGFELPFREAASPASPGSEVTLSVQSNAWLLLSGVS